MAKMMYKVLPGGLKMPVVGLGTWQSTNEEELFKAFDTALELGYRYIDTAYAYANEEIIGKVLKKWFDSGKVKREDLFITTKLPIFAVRPDKVEELMIKSLKNLGLNYVDLYLIHFPVCVKMNGDELDFSVSHFDALPTDHIAVWKKMEEQVDAGRAKCIGLSNFSIRQIEKILKSNPRIKPANLQVEVHVFFQQQELVKYCHANGITVTAYAPLGSPDYNKFFSQFRDGLKPLPNMLNDETINKLAKKHKKSNAQIMLKYLVERDIMVIPRSVKPSELTENISLFDFHLDADDMAALNALEVGEPARVCDFQVFPGLSDNTDEWPFPL